MAKLKQALPSEKENNKLGKIKKVKKFAEPAQMKRKAKSPSPSGQPIQKKFEHFTTPFSKAKNSMATSTPFIFETNKPSNAKRFPLSPIFSNSFNESIEANKSVDKNHKKQKETLTKGAPWDPEATNENVEPKFRIGTRKKPNKVPSDLVERKTKKGSSPQNAIVWDSSSNEIDKRNSSSFVSETSLSPEKRTTRLKSSEKSDKATHMLKRLQSDWSSRFDETTQPTNSVTKSRRLSTRNCKGSELSTDSSQPYRQNKCSELRVCLRRTLLDCAPSPKVNARSAQQSPLVNTFINNLRADWTDISLDTTTTSNQNKKVELKKQQKNGKRLLKSLVEVSSEDENPPSKTRGEETKNKKSITKNGEDEYSSSAEFQSDDEMNSLSRSKRAPTWRGLLNKTTETCPPKATAANKTRSLRVRLKSICSKSDIDSSSSSEEHENDDMSETKKEEHHKTQQQKKMRKVKVVVEALKNLPEKPPMIRSTRLSSKSLGNESDHNSINEESPPEPPKGKRKRTRNDAVPNGKPDEAIKEFNDVNEAKRAKPSRSRKQSLNKDTNEMDLMTDNKQGVEKAQQKSNDGKDSSSQSKITRRSGIRINSAVDKEKKVERKSEEKRQDNAECNVSEKASSEKVTQNVLEIPGINDSQRPVLSSPQQTQQNQLRKSNSLEKSSSSSTQNHHDETEKNITIDLTCPVKFFHSRLERTLNPPKLAATGKPEPAPRRRSSKRKQKDSVYEFLSQSSSDSNRPVDDVIQKMIASGKVVVAKHKKGTGTMTLPKKKPKKTQKKKNATKIDKMPEKTTNPAIVQKRPLQEIRLQDDNHDDAPHFDHDDFNFNNNDIDNNPQNNNDASNIESPPNEQNEQVRDQRGFSNLARSTMINRASGRIEKSLPKRKPIKDRKKLLEMAMKFVSQSTPVRETPQRPLLSSSMGGGSPNFCPTPIGAKSPWRVDDYKLPNTFYLGRNSDNLPSFSSDHIPMTPVKNKSKSMSSFSSNDSNGENQAPSGVNNITNQANFQTLANSRKALTHRSPLKALNILEVVNLPPLALHSYGKASDDKEPAINNKSKDASVRSSPQKSARNLFDNFSNHSKSENSSENIENQLQNTLHTNLNRSGSVMSRSTTTNKRHSGSDISQNSNSRRSAGSNDASNNTNNNNNITNLFGFEDLIDDENNSSQNHSVDQTILPNKENLKERLQRLKKLRPNKPVITSSCSNKEQRIKPVFDDVRPVQKNIKQMLCSTMINNDNENANESNYNWNESENLSNLFKDPDPETTFDDSQPRRTYNRPYVRKRKLCSRYSMFLESDISEDEEGEDKYLNPVKTKKPRSKKHTKKNPELKKFVNEFNEMCKEVSQYELVVE